MNALLLFCVFVGLSQEKSFGLPQMNERTAAAQSKKDDSNSCGLNTCSDNEMDGLHIIMYMEKCF